MKIKVMHVAQSSGGVERYLLMLLKYLNSDIFENILVCSKEYRDANFEEFVSVCELIDMKRDISLIDDYRACIQLRKLLKKYNPDILYLHSSKAGLIGRIAKINLNVKCLYNAHGWAFNMQCGSLKQNIYRIVEKILALGTQKIIAISDFEKKSALEKKICEESKITVIYNGIDIIEYETMPSSGGLQKILGIPAEAYVIGMVGRISAQKAPDTFVKVAKEIKRIIPNAYFIIVGNGDQEKQIKELISTYKLDASFTITGWVQNPFEYIKLFDQALLLSRWEGFGLVLVEYMLAKKPIVATKVDAIPDLIRSYENGILVDCDNVDEIVKAILRVKADNQLREDMVKQALFDAHKKYDIKRVAQEHEQLFCEIIERI